jgi:arylsulfatase
MAGTMLASSALPAFAAEILPKAPAPFNGVINADRDKSTPDWPKPVKAPAGAPNVLLVLLDDVGFGATSVSGGPISTPALDQLAAGGLRYNNFHVNSLCSPTRAALLSGRNDHQIGFGTVTEIAAGYPGYNSIWPKSAGSLAEVLRQNGYSTAAFGKWHNTPSWEVSPAGPFDHWPTGLGFEYFYGFLGGQDSQWLPRLYRGTVPVEPSKTAEQGYHLTTDLADDAISWLHQHDSVAPDKPFFLYFATGAAHTPHHVAPEWIAKYKGKFDQGWDKLREETFARQKAAGIIPANAELTPRPAELPAWDSLSPEQQKLLAHQAEIYAGFLEQTDHEVGRVVQAIRDEGKGDDTLVLYIVGDNGSSAEGGLEGSDARTVEGKPAPLAARSAIADQLGSETFFNHYSAAWAWGLDAPFQWTKQVASHLGGTTDPLVVSWPAKIKDKGAVRSQFQHVTDIAPTIFELAGIKPPEVIDGVKQIPLEGKSLAASFTDAKAPSTHRVQYFEMVGNRGIYKDGWWAGARHLLPWQAISDGGKTPIGQHPWELYNLSEDYSQAHDLAAQNPQKLKELVALFESEAKRNNVYPLAPLPVAQPSLANGRTHFVFRPGVERLTPRNVPVLRGRSHSLTASVEIPPGGAQGVIIADGGRNAGFTLYVKNGKPVYEVSANGHVAGRIEGAEALPPGKATITVEVTRETTGEIDRSIRSLFSTTPEPAGVRLLVNGTVVGEGRIANLVSIYGETLDIGKDLGSPVSADYPKPAAFTGTIETVALDLKP